VPPPPRSSYVIAIRLRRIRQVYGDERTTQTRVGHDATRAFKHIRGHVFVNTIFSSKVIYYYYYYYWTIRSYVLNITAESFFGFELVFTRYMICDNFYNDHVECQKRSPAYPSSRKQKNQVKTFCYGIRRDELPGLVRAPDLT